MERVLTDFQTRDAAGSRMFTSAFMLTESEKDYEIGVSNVDQPAYKVTISTRPEKDSEDLDEVWSGTVIVDKKHGIILDAETFEDITDTFEDDYGIKVKDILDAEPAQEEEPAPTENTPAPVPEPIPGAEPAPEPAPEESTGEHDFPDEDFDPFAPIKESEEDDNDDLGDGDGEGDEETPEGDEGDGDGDEDDEEKPEGDEETEGEEKPEGEEDDEENPEGDEDPDSTDGEKTEGGEDDWDIDDFLSDLGISQ